MLTYIARPAAGDLEGYLNAQAKDGWALVTLFPDDQGQIIVVMSKAAA